MNKYLFILGLTGIALFSACSTDGEEEIVITEEERERALIVEASQNSDVPINFGSDNSQLNITRAPIESGANNSFSTETGKYLGVFCMATAAQTGSSAPTETIDWTNATYSPVTVWMKNVPAVMNGNNVEFLTSSYQPTVYYYPVNDWYQYTFYAYYPRQNETEGNYTTLQITSDQVVEKYYTIDGSQDILWAMSSTADTRFAADGALPFCAKYIRKASAVENAQPDDYLPRFVFDHKMTQFAVQAKAASAEEAEKLKNCEFTIKSMSFDKVYRYLKLTVADKQQGTSNANGELSIFSAPATFKLLGVKSPGQDYDRFDQNGDNTADNPMRVVTDDDWTAISALAPQAAMPTKEVGYIMVPPTAVCQTKDANHQYIIVIDVEWKSGGSTLSATKYLTLSQVPQGGFLAGHKYTIAITFYSPTQIDARAELNSWDEGTNGDHTYDYDF